MSHLPVQVHIALYLTDIGRILFSELVVDDTDSAIRAADHAVGPVLPSVRADDGY